MPGQDTTESRGVIAAPENPTSLLAQNIALLYRAGIIGSHIILLGHSIDVSDSEAQRVSQTVLSEGLGISHDLYLRKGATKVPDIFRTTYAIAAGFDYSPDEEKSYCVAQDLEQWEGHSGRYIVLLGIETPRISQGLSSNQERGHMLANIHLYDPRYYTEPVPDFDEERARRDPEAHHFRWRIPRRNIIGLVDRQTGELVLNSGYWQQKEH